MMEGANPATATTLAKNIMTPKHAAHFSFRWAERRLAHNALLWLGGTRPR
jgi:hypothetical protein